MAYFYASVLLNCHTQISGGDYPSEHYSLWRLPALLLCYMTHYDITMGNNIAMDVHCNVTLSNLWRSCFVLVGKFHSSWELMKYIYAKTIHVISTCSCYIMRWLRAYTKIKSIKLILTKTLRACMLNPMVHKEDVICNNENVNWLYGV